MAEGTVIIGNGVAGITTARHLRKHSDQRIRVISTETPYFFSRTALMYVYMGHMKFDHIKPYEDWFWEKNRIELIEARVEKVLPESRELELSTGEILHFDKLVIATGSRTRYFNWPGQNLKGVQGLFSYQDLQLLEENTPAPFEKGHSCKKAIIIGAGLIGVELAEMLSTRGIEVTMLVRDSYFWGNVITENEGRQINEHIRSHGVTLHFNSEMKEALADENGRVKSVITTEGNELECQLIGITTGVTPNIEFLEGTGIETDKGILVNEYLQSNFENIYAAGDCAQMREPRKGRKSLEPVWYVGRMMGEVLGRTLATKDTAYRPGPWFNSAKFFDIEYQTYGRVDNRPQDEHAHFFWKWNGQNKFATIAYHPKTLTFQGANFFGVRVRHEYFHNALKKEMHVGEVVGGLKTANFDPEFYKSWYKDLQREFENKTGIKVSKPSILKNLLTR
jgi:NADPH-dependent 2,4-dienoyl-CoA reductase/sulfur reductase-like enzyme